MSAPKIVLPPILRGVRRWVQGPTGYYERRSSSDRLRLRMLGWLLAQQRSTP
jgi:hypothetical protein